MPILILCLASGAAFAKGHHPQSQAKHAKLHHESQPHKRKAVARRDDNPGAHADIVVDAASNTVLHAHNAGEPWYPASLTKLMTAYLTFDAIEAGRVRPSDHMTVSHHAAQQKGSRLGLRTGERITVDEAIHGLIVRSANDAAVTLAEHISGNEGDFAAAMTAKAKQLGMQRTSFQNATGLPAPQQISSARDMAVLAQNLIKRFPSHYHYFQADGMTFHRRNMNAINPLLRTYQGAEGMKTGFTCASGYNIVGAAKRDGRRLVAVYLGGSSRDRRNAEVTRLLNAGFADNRDPTRLPELDDASLLQATNQHPIHRLGPNVCNSTVPPVNAAANSAPQRGGSVLASHAGDRRPGHSPSKRLRAEARTGQATVIARGP
jgi:D-alanyl-D-alanine carboxypeptidase